MLGWRLVRRLAQQPPAVATPMQVDDFLTWATLGVVLGGRLGYVLFYQPGVYLGAPAADPRGLAGRHELPRRHAGRGDRDRLVLPPQRHPAARLCRPHRGVAPIGLGLGRIANFINGELWGRPAPDWLPWAMIFPDRRRRCRAIPASSTRRCWKGWCCSCVMFVLSRREALRARFGLLTGVFLVGYGIARIIGEFFREPDAFLGFLVVRRHHGPVACHPDAAGRASG